jgi:hypothetical protein
MGIFTHEIVLLDVLFKRNGVNDTAETVSAVSMTPLKFGNKNFFCVVEIPMIF